MSNKENQFTTGCNLEIDYSLVAADKILPFQISLNLTDSILEPAPNQNQKFCYDIIGVGQDNSDFADLSHSVFSICDEIPKEQIANVTVVIDGVPQEVIFEPGGNVELKTPLNPDPPTGCAGLKFDFPLDKVIGTMQLCFELTITRAIDGIEVCLFGAGETVKGLYICGPNCDIVIPCLRFQAITDIITSTALEQTALSHILNAEGEKTQKIVLFATTAEEMLAVNKSVIILLFCANIK